MIYSLERRSIRGYLSASACAICFMYSAPVHAQENTAVSTEAVPTEAVPTEAAPTEVVRQDVADVGPEDIIVTAQRRRERLEDVPMSIVAVSQESIARAGITGVRDLGQIATGVRIEYAGGFTQPSIRGVTTLTTGGGFENNVAVYVDGFYSPDTISINSDLPNISDVQILKGPQGTLYGRNATGGAIVINTLAPSDTLTGSAQVSYGRFNEIAAGAFVSGPITNDVRASIAAYNRHSDGYYKYIDPAGTGRKFGHAAPIRQYSVRAKLEADLSPNLTATLSYNDALSNDPRGLIFTNQGYAPDFLPKPPFAASGRDIASTNVRTSNATKLHEGTGKVVLKTGLGTITSYTGYARRNSDYTFDFDATYAKILEAIARWRQKTFQQTVDVTVDTPDQIDLVIGGSYFNDKTANDGSTTILFGGPLDRTFANLTTDAWAVYADGTYRLTDRLSFNVGGRYTHEKKHIDYRQVDAATETINFVPPASANASFSAFTPRATIRYELAPRTNVYASVSRGFRSGGFQPTPVPDPVLLVPFKPEKITAYEMGFKTARGIFRFDAAAFYYDYRDLQVGVTKTNPINNSLINFVSNAKKAEIYGLDLSTSVEPTRGLTLRGGVSLLRGRYKDFKDATAVGLDAATNLNVEQVQDWSGLQMARAPKVSGNAGAEYDAPLAGGTLRLSANASFTSSFPQGNPSLFGPLAGSLANKQRYKVGGYTEINAQIGWTEPSDHFTVTVFGTNLTDTRYLINYGGTSFGGDVGVFNQPRSFGVKGAFKY